MGRCPFRTEPVAARAPHAGSRLRPRWLALVLPLWLCAACHLAPARVWNLEQLHTPEGAPRRRGNLKSDFGYLLSSSLGATGFGGPEFQAKQAKEKRISDPLGTCLENVVELADCPRSDSVAGLQAATFAWLAVDCTYVLSRERCTLELAGLAQTLRMGEWTAPPAPSATPSTPEELKAALDRLVEVVRQVLAAPAFAGGSLDEACGAIGNLALDRQGTLRVLRALNALVEHAKSGAVFEPMRALHLEFERRAVAQALRLAIEDKNGYVRSAALEASVRAFPTERATLLRNAILDPEKGVEAPEQLSLRALVLLARYGLPPVPPEVDADAFRNSWCDLLAQILRTQIDGPHGITACRAMQKVLGGEPTLLPEVWLARWRAARPAASPVSSGDPAPTLEAEPTEAPPDDGDSR